MIALEPATAGPHGVTIWVRPNRSLSLRGLRTWIGGLVAAACGTALWMAQQGNVFAPLFALLESAALVTAFVLVWRGGERGERITVDAHVLQLERMPARARAQFQTYWVRVAWRSGPGRRRLVLASHGREVEVGAFLADDERNELRQKLQRLVAAAKAPQARSELMIRGAIR